jgi:hypothetical protein
MLWPAGELKTRRRTGTSLFLPGCCFFAAIASARSRFGLFEPPPALPGCGCGQRAFRLQIKKGTLAGAFAI